MNRTVDEGLVRIGELSRRAGVSTDLLRAWERRYGLLRPARTTGGFRLYSADDERRVALMRVHLARGLSAAEAAALALAGDEPAGGHDLRVELDREAGLLAEALDGFQEERAQTALDRLLAGFTLETVLGAVVLPYLHDLGERWARGEATVAQEHFASNLLRARVLGLARGWDRGSGPRALLACLPGELHDLPLAVFGLALRSYGWRITFFGADTPVETLSAAADLLAPSLVVLSGTNPGTFGAVSRTLAELARRHPLSIAGRDASAGLAESLGCGYLDGDAVAAASVAAAAG